jgi:hypothetical protein
MVVAATLGEDAGGHGHDADRAADVDRLDTGVDENAEEDGGGKGEHGSGEPQAVGILGRLCFYNEICRLDSPVEA